MKEISSSNPFSFLLNVGYSDGQNHPSDYVIGLILDLVEKYEGIKFDDKDSLTQYIQDHIDGCE